MKIRILIVVVLYCSAAYGQVTKIDFNLSRQDLQTFLTRDLFKKEYLPMTLTVQGTTYTDSKIRFKGNTSRLYPKRGLRIKLGKNNPKPQIFGGMGKMNFNPLFTDKSFMREKLVWDIFRIMDGLGPKEYGYANVFINGVDNGLFLMIQHVDDEYLKDNSRADGDIYEAGYDEPIGNLTLPADGNLKKAFEKHAGDENDFTAITDLINKLNNTSDADFASVVKELFDMKSVYDFYVLNAITMQADTDDKNYMLYRDPSKQSQMWSIIPWDYDMTFGRDGESKVPYPLDLLNDYFVYTYEPLAGQSNVLKDRLLKDPVLKAELRDRMYDVVQNIFNEEKLYPLIDEVTAQVEEYARKDPGKWGTYKEFRDQAEALKYFITGRRNFLLTTYLNPRSGENDIVTLNVSSTGTQYDFVDYDGVVVASLNFTNMSGLQKVTVRAYPSVAPRGLPEETSIKRYIEIMPYPSNASFSATLRWQYLQNTDLTEVGSGVLNEGLLQSVNYVNGSWQKVDSYVNPYGNYAQIENVTAANTGEGRYFALTIPEVNSGVWNKQKNSFWQRWNDAGFSNDQNGFAAGDDGTVIFSNDGGLNWKQVYVGSHTGLKTISALNSNTYVTAGMYGFMFKTNSGGATWVSVNSGVTANINKLDFIGDKGWAACDKGTILVTNNGGSSWSAKQVSGSKNICALISFNENDVIAGGDEGAIYRSNDGGSSWSNVTSGTMKRINSFARDGKNAIGVCDGGIIVFSSDVGATWREYKTGGESNLFSAGFNGHSLMYAGGENGAFYVSSDGMNWKPDFMRYTFDIRSLVFTPSGDGFAFCNSGAILRFR